MKDEKISDLSRKHKNSLKRLEEEFSFVKFIRSLEKNDTSKLLFDNQIITIEDLANYISVSPKTVQNWVSLRTIPFLRVGRKTLFRRSQIDAWLKTKEFKPCL